MKIGKILVIIFCALITFGCTVDRQDVASKPNIVLFLADDLSYYDTGTAGNPFVKTPAIDKFRSEGMSFERMYTPTAMCAPSRSSLYTGLYPHKHGCHNNHGSVKDGTESLPKFLADLGYNVGLVGKQHIKPKSSFPFEYVKFKDVENYVEKVKGIPFCMIYASGNPHTPHKTPIQDPDSTWVPPNWIDTPEARYRLTEYYRDIEDTDKEFEMLIDLLKKNNLYDNTIVIFSSDHGYEYFQKWTNYEAGLRVPFYVKWKNTVKPNSVNTNLTSFIDVLPTFIEIAGGKSNSAQFDGKSFIDNLKGNNSEIHEYIYGTHTNRGIISGGTYPTRSIRTGDYQFIMNLRSDTISTNLLTHGNSYDLSQSTPVFKSWQTLGAENSKILERANFLNKRPSEELYYVKKDSFELENLATDPRYSEIRDKLKGELIEWMASQGDLGVESEMKIKQSVKK